MFAKKRRNRCSGVPPPTKRPKFQEDTSFISASQNVQNLSGSLSELGSRLRDWMSWIANFAANKTLAARNFFSSANSPNRHMAVESSQDRVKTWKLSSKNPQAVRENLALTRQPLHEERRWMSLQPSQHTLSPGNPFKDSSTKTALTPNKVTESDQRLQIAVAWKANRNRALDGDVSIYATPAQENRGKKKKKKAFQKNFLDTARQAVRLEEKEQYQLLLNQHKKRYEGIVPYRQPVFESRGIQTEKSTSPVSSCASAFSRESLSASSRRNMTKWLKVRSSNDQTATSSAQVHESATSDWQEPEVIDSDLEITKIEMPPKSKSVPLQVRESPFFSNDWIQDLKKTITIDCKENTRRIQEQERKAKLMQEKREARLSSENMKLFERVKQRTILPESPEASDEEEDSSQYPECTPEMESRIEDALRPNPPDEILVEGFRLSVTRRDMETLSGLNWLNDEIINFYMNMLMERGKMDNFPSVYAFNTFFYPKLVSSGHAALKRWTRKIDIFSYNFILIPVHLGMHWCLAVIDFPQKKIQYYDSMGGQNNECLHSLSAYLKEECLDKKRTDFEMNDWKMEAVKNIPHQMNGSDCGMFALKYAEYITRNSKITFTQAHMPYFRRRMVYEILTKRLL